MILAVRSKHSVIPGDAVRSFRDPYENIIPGEGRQRREAVLPALVRAHPEPIFAKSIHTPDYTIMRSIGGPAVYLRLNATGMTTAAEARMAVRVGPIGDADAN